MLKKILSIKEISEYYDTYYFDQWGVVHDGIKSSTKTDSYSYGVVLRIVRGNGITCLIWSDPHNQLTVLSMPRPKPE